MVTQLPFGSIQVPEQAPPPVRAEVSAEDAASMAKLADDLRSLHEKIKLCREMLPESPGVQYDETLAEVGTPAN